MGGGEEKTEAATPKKRRDERKKGNVNKSQDVTAVVTLLSAVVVLRLIFVGAAEDLGDFLRYCISLMNESSVGEISDSILLPFLWTAVKIAGPVLAASIGSAAISTMAQTRLLVTAEPLKPKFSRINPINGVKNLFSLEKLVQLVMNLIKITVLLVVVYSSVRNMISIASQYLYADLNGSAKYLLEEIYNMLLRVALIFFVMAAIDYLFQWWNYERKLKMTKQEIKEEYKQTEGDPKVKGKIKQMQQEMSRSRMMSKVPQSDVIIRNPTHVAVALRYHPDEDEAPVILAMGADFVAMKIVELAEQNNILVMENVALARALFAEGELDRPIPSDLYEAVAEVMVYLYKLGRLKS